MEFCQLGFLFLIMTECCFRTNANGLCEFARKFPCEDNGGLVCYKHGCATKRTHAHMDHSTKQPTTNHSTQDYLRSKESFPEISTTNQSATYSEPVPQTTADYATIKQGSDKHETTEDPIPTTTSCPPNMVYANCTTGRGTCQNPTGSSGNCTVNESCVCVAGFLMKEGSCIPENTCGCFIDGVGVIRDNGTYVNDNCSEKCTCKEETLECTSDYTCSIHASCKVERGVRQCYCNEGFEGDGETCIPLFTDCYDAYQANHTTDGVYTILPAGWTGSPFSVVCNMTTDADGGWTVFQRRTDGISDFYRDWSDYKHGFGSVDQGKDFWLGNEQIYYLTNQKEYELRVDIITSNDEPFLAKYASFRINDESSKYQLHVSGYTGNAEDGLFMYDNGGLFTTRDQDNDDCSFQNCAVGLGGAWWYRPAGTAWCTTCLTSSLRCSYFGTGNCINWCSYGNLNGVYNGTNGQNIFWNVYCNLRFADMKIRPSSS